ncbi:MAG TPA: BON domain-containing protein [Casimicrobiaceae bacterium]|nr:BON domain-containing protein [Casimicrobiaceae bacterium]
MTQFDPIPSRSVLMVSALAFSLLASGCVPLIVAGAAGTALVATDRRSTGVQVDDEAIELKISQHENSRYGGRAHISATSYNGIVLLTGEAPDQAAKNEIGEYARTTERVRAVQNEIVVAPPSPLGSRSNDTYITSVVKTRFLEAKDVFSATHVKVVTDRRVVYLMGIVKRSEADAAARIAATTSGVERVVKVFEYQD